MWVARCRGHDFCSGLEGLFASKPAPTFEPHFKCGSGLAREGVIPDAANYRTKICAVVIAISPPGNLMLPVCFMVSASKIATSLNVPAR